MKYSEIINNMFGSKDSRGLSLHDGTVISTLFIKSRVSTDEIEIPNCAVYELQKSIMSKQCKKQIINHEIDYLITPVYVNSTRVIDSNFTGTIEYGDYVLDLKYNVQITKTTDGKYRTPNGQEFDKVSDALRVAALEQLGAKGYGDNNAITLDPVTREAKGFIQVGSL